MSTVSIIDLNNVIVDGKPAGHLFDAVRNLPLAAADLKAAFDVWIIGHLNGVREAHNKCALDLAEAKATAQSDIAAKEAEHAAEKAKLEADIAALGTKPEAQAIRKAQERAAKLAAIEAMRAEIAKDEEALEPQDAKTSTPESGKP
jgi:hypothetical protein